MYNKLFARNLFSYLVFLKFVYIRIFFLIRAMTAFLNRKSQSLHYLTQLYFYRKYICCFSLFSRELMYEHMQENRDLEKRNKWGK